MDAFTQHVRYAVRQLLRGRSTTIVAILTLALGIGANTSMLTMVNLTLFAAPPGVSPAGLVWLTNTHGRDRIPDNMSYPDYRDLRDRTHDLSGVLAYTHAWLSLGGSTPERVRGEVVTGNYFDLLDVAPQRGRLFHTADDGAPRSNPVAVLSDGLWRRRFAASPGVVDSTVTINGQPFVIVGIAPPEFEGVELNDDAPQGIWLPMSMLPVAEPETWAGLDDRNSLGWLRVIGRLRPGTVLDHANAELAALSPPIQQMHADKKEPMTFTATRMAGRLDPSNRAEASRAMTLLMLVPLLVLIVACANAANVMLARGLARRKEMATRRALGATPARLVTQLLTESVAMSLVAGVAGILLSFWMTWLIAELGVIPAGIVRALGPDQRVLGWTLALAAITGVAFGVLPAIATARQSLIPALKDDGAGVVAGRQRKGLRDAFIIAQTAVSLLLLVTAGLFVQSLAKALRSDPGFAAREGVVIKVDLARQGYDSVRRDVFARQLLVGVQSTPGVRHAALASTVPLGGTMEGGAVVAEGAADGATVSAFESSVSPDYFATIDAPLVAGRGFSDHDDAATAPVVIVNERLAQRLWPDGHAVGKQLRFGSGDAPLREVIGIARDGKYSNLTEGQRSYLYFPMRQRPAAHFAVLASAAGTAAALASVRDVSRAIDPDLPLFGETTFAAMIASAADLQRATAATLSVFGTVALLLAALGMFGIAAHAVTLRTREIGIRIALGARSRDVLAMFLREGVLRSLVGVGIGLVMSVAVSKLLAHFLFGLAATDLVTFASASLALCGVAAVATYFPARRAARVDPNTALRGD